MKCLIAGFLLAPVCAGAFPGLVSTASAQAPFRNHASRGVLMPAPLGTYTNAWYDAQAGAAAADQFVIYLQEWLDDGTTLGPYGGYHLQRIVERLPAAPYQVVIQVDLRNQKINLARQTFIVNQLLAAGVTDAQARVVVGYPRAEGLFGDEASRIFLQTFSGTRTGNMGGTSGSGGSGSSFGGGLGIPGGGTRGY